MRLAACALSAVLLSGCSWLGMGGQSNGYGTSGGAYGVGCAPVQTAPYGQYGGQYGQSGAYGGDAGCAGGAYGVAQGYGPGAYGQGGYGQGFGAGQGYGAGGQGYGQAGFGQGGAGFGQAGFGPGGAGYGQAGYGAGAAGFGQAGYGGGAAGFGPAGYGSAGFGQAGYGPAGFGPAGVGAGLAAQGIGSAYGANTVYGAGGATTLGAGAPFGANAYGGNVVGTQLANGQYVNGAYVQNVVGAPIYVPQPYPAPYGVPQLRGVGAALPFGLEFFGGSEFDVSGDLVTAKAEGPSAGGGGRAGAFDAIGYDDAFSDGYTFGAEGSYDISRNTTLLASAAYSKKEGQAVDTGSFQSGVYDASGNFTPDIGSSTPRDLTGQFSDLEQYTIEGGVRQYVGQNVGFRPYVGAKAGFAYNNDVTLTQTFDDGAAPAFGDPQNFIDSGWRPTAAGVVGAEMAVGGRGAIGVETGLRWRDNLKGDSNGEDRISIPVKLRGRLAF